MEVVEALRATGFELVDFCARCLTSGDDYPDEVVSLSRAVANGEVERGVAFCGSGVGALIAANKAPDVRAGLFHEVDSAHQDRTLAPRWTGQRDGPVGPSSG